MIHSDVTPSPVDINNFSNRCDSFSQDNEISMTISAPGKVILYGEHSVVYGKLAIAASLGLRTTLTFTEEIFKNEQTNYLKVELPNIGLSHIYDIKDIQHSLLAPVLPLTKSPSNFNWTKPHLINHDELLHIVLDYVNRCAGSFPLTNQQNLSLTALFFLLTGILASANVELKPCTLRVETDLSISSGSGSSASYSVTIAAAFIHFIRLMVNRKKVKDISKSGYKASKAMHVDIRQFTEKELEIISNWAFLSEKIMHGAPSGIDNTVCTYGSLVEFRKTTGSKPLKFSHPVKLMLINTNVKRDTKGLVNMVAVLKQRYSTVIERILEAMEEVAHDAASCLLALNNSTRQQDITECYHKLGELTDFNQHLLRTLGVSHTSLDRICHIAKSFNLNAKLTGAGGGGYAIVLLSPYVSEASINQLTDKLNSEGYKTVVSDLAGPGVRIDSCNSTVDIL